MTAMPLLHDGDFPTRSEQREPSVHVVEYSRYPRRNARERRRVGYTQDRSATGLGLDLAEPLSEGELLRVTLRDIDERTALDGLARVVWCRAGSHERYRAGLAVLRDAGQRPLLRGRRPTSEFVRNQSNARLKVSASGEAAASRS